MGPLNSEELGISVLNLEEGLQTFTEKQETVLFRIINAEPANNKDR